MTLYSFVFFALGCAVTASRLTDPTCYAPEDIITRDVAVIGGGSSGTYGAIALKDRDISVVIVEREAVFGGHTNTYFVPETGVPVDYGVQAFWHQDIALDFFARFDVPTIPYASGGEPEFFDFSSGEAVPNVSITYDLSKYAVQLYKYPELFTGFNLEYPVAEDLLITFGDFIIKYGLEDEVWNMQPFLGGVANPADLLDQITLNMLIWLGQAYTEVADGVDVMTEKPDHYNGEIFAKALTELQGVDSALLESTVIEADRDCAAAAGGVCVAVKTPNGTKLILAKKLLVTIPPVPWNMEPFGLDKNELGLFSTFNYSGYYAGLLKSSGLEDGVVYWNAGANTTYNLPTMPGSYYLSPTNVEGISLYWYGSPTLISREDIEAGITGEIRRLTSNEAQAPEFVAFADHSPFKLVAGADEIANGFYEDLLGLQGQKNTWYSGAAFVSHNSVVLWNYTANLVPDIIASLY
ncbi:hypothetical protein F5883DRAFT_548486 [Diaporthe sp. PMI_573]|nr:hypothetical protein F5883DRAFT_548486 [Diaporthaceae sp. PMI_573]